MNYIAYDAVGKILWAQANTPEGVQLPSITGATLVVVSEDDYALAKPHSFAPISAYWDGTKVVATPPSPGSAYTWDWTSKSWTLDMAAGIAAKNAQITAAAQAALAAVVAAYPDLEVSTWPQQYTEAQAYTASNGAATPMLSAIAAASGKTVAALAANVMAKAAAYQVAAGAVVGKRIALQTKASAATTQADLDAIAW